MMGSGSHVQAIKSSGISSYTASTTDCECEEEVVSLASMVEKIMKNLRLGISQLRRSLEESRSANERLQSLTQKQAQMIEDNTLYIKELEDMDKVLTQNVEELLMEIKEIEAEVARWREACELEVEAGKKEVEERGKLQELEKTKAALEISNDKLKLKEDPRCTNFLM
ncbi:putative ATP binding protein [Corchorus olitorius]|uniref:ATP binding protein n=1 Tax=Corchorus olitorius TaxID=93759 RepID=A0A1R3JTD6_9ROSI|nr:putative ATP binding protein [Corchorus olitorius]